MPLLSLVIWVPILGGVWVLYTGATQGREAVLMRSLMIAAVTFLLSLPLYSGFDTGTHAMQFVERTGWIEAFDINYHLGIDGISMPLILLTTFTTVLVVLAGWESIQTRIGQYMAFFLILEGLMKQGVVAGNHTVDVLKAKKVAIIHDKDTYGQGLADATKAQLNKRGVKEVLYEGLTRGEKDFNALVTKLRASGAEVVYFGGLHPEAGPLVRQMREQGLTAIFMSDDGVVTDELVTTAGGPQYVKDVLMTFGADPRAIPEGQAVVEKLRAAGFEPEGYTLYAYASVQTLAAAFNGVGQNDVAKASEWLKSNPVQTVMGKKEWDQKGDLKVSDYVVYKWDEQGKYHQVQ